MLLPLDCSHRGFELSAAGRRRDRNTRAIGRGRRGRLLLLSVAGAEAAAFVAIAVLICADPADPRRAAWHLVVLSGVGVGLSWFRRRIVARGPGIAPPPPSGVAIRPSFPGDQFDDCIGSV